MVLLLLLISVVCVSVLAHGDKGAPGSARAFGPSWAVPRRQHRVLSLHAGVVSLGLHLEVAALIHLGLDHEVPDELGRVGALSDQLPDLGLVRLPAPVLKVLPHLALRRARCECIPLERWGRGCQRLLGDLGPEWGEGGGARGPPKA